MLVCAVLGISVVASTRSPPQATTMVFLALAERRAAAGQHPLCAPAVLLGLADRSVLKPEDEWAALLSLVGMVAVVYVPFLNPIFGTLPLSLVHWAWVLPGAFVPAVVVRSSSGIAPSQRLNALRRILGLAIHLAHQQAKRIGLGDDADQFVAVCNRQPADSS